MRQQLIDKQVLGIHIRMKDGGHPQNKIQRLYDKIKLFYHQHPQWYIYVASDSLEIETVLCKQYKRILVSTDILGETYQDKVANNQFGFYNGICELFVLSQCNQLWGTKNSSFSVMAWLLSDIDKLIIW